MAKRVLVAGKVTRPVVVVVAAVVEADPAIAYRLERAYSTPRAVDLDYAFRLVDRKLMDRVHESRRSRRA